MLSQSRNQVRVYTVVSNQERRICRIRSDAHTQLWPPYIRPGEIVTVSQDSDINKSAQAIPVKKSHLKFHLQDNE